MDSTADDGVGARTPRPAEGVAARGAERLAAVAGEPPVAAPGGTAPCPPPRAPSGHELKAPLAVIKGAATTLLAHTGLWDGATQQELLQLIDAQTDRLHDLVNALLDARRPDEAAPGDRAEPQPAPPPPVAGHRRAHERPVVLVAERDARLARYLRAHLEAQGYRATLAPTADQLARLLDLEEPDLVLVDAGLCERVEATLGLLREHDGTPALVLGGGQEVECVRALDLGAADYLARPFGLPELLARVRVELRRRAQAGAGARRPAVFRSGDLTIDFAQHQVEMGGRPVQLSRTEYRLLRALAEHAPRVLSHDLLLERVWGPGYGGEVEFLWVYVRRLRRKIEPEPRSPRYITTVPGVGYRLAQLQPTPPPDE